MQNVGLPFSYLKLLLSSWKHICAMWRHGISTISGDTYGHKLCSTNSGLIFILLWVDCMSNVHISKRYNLTDMLNDTSGYIDEISPSITLNLRNIFLIYIQQNFSWTKQILQRKKLFPWFKYTINVFGSDVQSSVYNKHDNFGSSKVSFPWLNGDVHRLPSNGILHFSVGKIC